jgi:hypothetical protein
LDLLVLLILTVAISLEEKRGFQLKSSMLSMFSLLLINGSMNWERIYEFKVEIEALLHIVDDGENYLLESKELKQLK